MQKLYMIDFGSVISMITMSKLQNSLYIIMKMPSLCISFIKVLFIIHISRHISENLHGLKVLNRSGYFKNNLWL